jgi:hypothetical protein
MQKVLTFAATREMREQTTAINSMQCPNGLKYLR